MIFLSSACTVANCTVQAELSRNINVKQEKAMAKYRCTVCGYIYDPAAGDSTQGVSPGTAFENLPVNWVCPECGVAKDMFEKV